MAKPNKNAKLGEGGRFAYVKQQAAKSGAKNPGAVAAAIGRKKYGKEKFQKMAAAGRRRHSKMRGSHTHHVRSA
jgi:hypothetical protein